MVRWDFAATRETRISLNDWFGRTWSSGELEPDEDGFHTGSFTSRSTERSNISLSVNSRFVRSGERMAKNVR
jgi:hypothetical protein